MRKVKVFILVCQTFLYLMNVKYLTHRWLTLFVTDVVIYKYLENFLGDHRFVPEQRHDANRELQRA